MIPQIKSEFRKMLTVRSTYVVSTLALLFIAFVNFYFFGYKLGAATVRDPNLLGTAIISSVSSVAVFGALLGLLLMTHEYRYNTIMHTLTISNSRTKTLLAKILTVSAYAIVFTLTVAVVGACMVWLGVTIRGATLDSQTIHFADILWRSLFYGWGYAMFGLLMGVLLRNQVGAIVGLLILPITIEAPLAFLLKNNAVYLPFSALGSVLQVSPLSNISHAQAALVFLGYLGIGWVAAWLLFTRRDAA